MTSTNFPNPDGGTIRRVRPFAAAPTEPLGGVTGEYREPELVDPPSLPAWDADQKAQRAEFARQQEAKRLAAAGRAPGDHRAILVNPPRLPERPDERRRRIAAREIDESVRRSLAPGSHFLNPDAPTQIGPATRSWPDGSVTIEEE
jgi:hypothetical protein